MKITNLEDFALQLVRSESEDEVINILKSKGLWEHPGAWRLYGDKENNFSTIAILGASTSDRKEKTSSRESLIFGLRKEVIELRKACKSVDYSITNETNGSLKEGISFTAIEAEMQCTGCSNEDFKTKTIIYALESSKYLYILQFKAFDINYDKDIIVFKQLLDSMKFVDH